MAKAKILVVEDEDDVCQLLRATLAAEGYRVFLAPNAERGLACLRREQPDLAIVDVMLPGMSGLDFCRIVRQESRLPLLFITARTSEVDKIVALKMGGDDYICKPFSINEVLVRIEVLLRRVAPESDGSSRIIAANGILLDPDRRQVVVQGRLCELPHLLFELLKTLMGSKGRVLSRELLLQRVWGLAAAAELETRTVDQHIARLRQKLGHLGELIETIPKSGYRFAFEPRKRGAKS